MNRMARAAVPLLALLVAACTAPGPARPRSHWADEPARGGRPLGHSVTDSRGGLDEASFALDSGVTTVTLRVADLGGDLYRIRTPDDAGIAPWVQRDDADLRLFTQGTGLPGPASVDVTLHSAVRWHLRLGGGAEDERIDLRGGGVSAVEFVAGAGRVSLTLPAPRGTVPVRMTGGAGEFLVSVADRAPVRVRVGGGAGSVVVDGAERTGIPGNTVIEGQGWSSAVDRYDVDLAAGVSRFVLDRG